MTAVARRASCSKETLYKWFGDRDGLLTATVQWQAARKSGPPVRPPGLDARGLRDSLKRFRRELAGGDFQRHFDRAQPGGDRPCRLGQEQSRRHRAGEWRFAIGERLKPVLEAGREAGLLDFDDAETAFRTFFGLVGRDVQIRLLLGDG
jgi:AcrR family transcriptional regulator